MSEHFHSEWIFRSFIFIQFLFRSDFTKNLIGSSWTIHAGSFALFFSVIFEGLFNFLLNSFRINQIIVSMFDFIFGIKSEMIFIFCLGNEIPCHWIISHWERYVWMVIYWLQVYLRIKIHLKRRKFTGRIAKLVSNKILSLEMLETSSARVHLWFIWQFFNKKIKNTWNGKLETCSLKCNSLWHGRARLRINTRIVCQWRSWMKPIDPFGYIYHTSYILAKTKLEMYYSKWILSAIQSTLV